MAAAAACRELAGKEGLWPPAGASHCGSLGPRPSGLERVLRPD